MSLRRRDLAGAIGALAVAALFVRLGVWQLHRLAERVALGCCAIRSGGSA